MKIGELARLSGLPVTTLRYYEQIGLLPYVLRDRSKQREYDASILTWIAFLGRLKATGMPIAEMLRYAKLRELGPGTAAERRQLLEQHREKVRVRVSELQECLLILDAKIDHYAEAEQRSNDHELSPNFNLSPEPAGKPLRTRPARPR
jgi:DNA-binding transcriptional MerR regulator